MPEQNWGFVVLLNSSHSGQPLNDLNLLAIDFLSKDFPKAQQAPINPLPSDLKKFSGDYAPRAPRNQLFAFLEEHAGGTGIRVINGKLTRSRLLGNPAPLLCVGKNLFRSETEPEGTTLFFPNESGQMALVGDGLEGIPYSERSFLIVPFLRIFMLALCLFLMLPSLPFAIVWLFLKLIGFMKDVRHLSVRVAPLLDVAAAVRAHLFPELNRPAHRH